ncbi:MAG: hypothetical protein R3F55_23305 [Alphaproteobacteria bacterium]
MDSDGAAGGVGEVVCSLFSGAACATAPTVADAQACAAVDFAEVYQLRSREAADMVRLEVALAVLEQRMQSPDLCSIAAELAADGTVTLHVVRLGEPGLPATLLDPGVVAFYEVDDTRSTTDIAPGIAVLPDRRGEPIVVKWESLLPAEPIDEAMAEQLNGGWTIQLVLTWDAAEAFTAATTRLIGQRLALVVDGVVMMAPTIMEPIPGRSLRISGNFDAAEAQALAAKLNGGQLPDGVVLELLGQDFEALPDR